MSKMSFSVTRSGGAAEVECVYDKPEGGKGRLSTSVLYSDENISRAKAELAREISERLAKIGDKP